MHIESVCFEKEEGGDRDSIPEAFIFTLQPPGQDIPPKQAHWEKCNIEDSTLADVGRFETATSVIHSQFWMKHPKTNADLVSSRTPQRVVLWWPELDYSRWWVWPSRQRPRDELCCWCHWFWKKTADPACKLQIWGAPQHWRSHFPISIWWKGRRALVAVGCSLQALVWEKVSTKDPRNDYGSRWKRCHKKSLVREIIGKTCLP